MTKLQARLLILILAMRRVPFKLERRGNVYIVQFAQAEALAVTRAAGA